MNMSSAPQCSSSGCESGWTLYLDQTSLSKTQCHGFGGFADEGYTRMEGHEEEEDLSMVSDASSGPRHYCEDDHEHYYCGDQSATKSKNKKKSKDKEHERRSQQQQHSCLDDTASSPVLSKKVSKNEASTEHVLEFSQGFSATHFKGKSALKKHFGFFQSSNAEKSASKDLGGFQGRKWK